MPVLSNGPAGRGRSGSRLARWRAASLVFVHLLVLGHIVQWFVSGRTLTPVEPSETMETLETGSINAGAIFFAVSILATLVFGRFFCGWACHFIAYQDLCNWLLKKVGIRPKPLRSRLLIFVPLALAVYMFLWPTLYRWWIMWQSGDSARYRLKWTSGLTTEHFWETFPGWVFALLTVGTAGFAIVYFLGAKGFCTYGCPYGAIYGLVDQASPMRVRVSDACDGSSVCTSVCTSNVNVADEVRKYGMVVNPGCMKCGDCVSACPNKALSFSWGAPAVLKKPRRRSDRRQGSKGNAALPWGEEFLILAAFGVFLFAFRGLYGGFPLLMTAGLSGILAFIVLIAVRLIYRPDVKLQNVRLKADGILRTGGWMLGVGVVALLLFTTHSGIVQYHRHLGDHYFDRTAAGEAVWQAGFDPDRDLTPEVREARDRAARHLQARQDWSLFDTVDLNNKRAWIALLHGDYAAAEEFARQALALKPGWGLLHENLGRILRARGRHDEAVAEFREAVRLEPDLEDAAKLLGESLLSAGRLQEALAHYLKRAAGADDAGAHYYAGALAAQLGMVEQAKRSLRRAIEIAPDMAEAHYQLGYLHLTTQRLEEAADGFTHALRLKPDYQAAHYNLAVARFMQGRLDDAVVHARRAARLDPRDAQAAAFLDMLLRSRDEAGAAHSGRR